MNDDFYDPSEEDESSYEDEEDDFSYENEDDNFAYEDEEDDEEREDEDNEDSEDGESISSSYSAQHMTSSNISYNTQRPSLDNRTFHNDHFDNKLDILSPGNSKSSSSDLLQNGYQRQDYLDIGFTDDEIEFWGLDQPNAPDPHSAGYIIADSFDGELDGNLSWPFKS